MRGVVGLEKPGLWHLMDPIKRTGAVCGASIYSANGKVRSCYQVEAPDDGRVCPKCAKVSAP